MTYEYIDTHVHLNDEKILAHLDEVIKDALNANVKHMYVVGWDLDSSKKAIELAEKYSFIYAIIGFHPSNIKGYSNYEYDWLLENGSHEKVVAIGEIGFDFYWDDTTKEEQLDAFRKQVEIARILKKPISIHSRDAQQITFDEVMATKAYEVGGVIHAFAGSKELAIEYIKRGFVLGVGGVVTFKNARVLTEVVKEVPLDAIVTETDSPYLTPHPYRGTENGPKYIPLVVEKICSIKNIDEETVKKKILENTLRIFKKI